MMDWSFLILNHICPALGVVMSTMMYAAPVHDLRQCIIDGSLGALNPIPWAIQTGNCFGWVIYAYYKSDIYLLASNLPGFLVSLWLNKGAVKLQFLEERRTLLDKECCDEKSVYHGVVFVSQERLLAYVILMWSAIMVSIGWLLPLRDPAQVVGVLVNLNLIFFYAAPLQSIWKVIRTQASDTIHVPTMLMNVVNTSFWLAYGFARTDIYIMIPNGLGLLLGCTQGAVCLLYPSGGGNNEISSSDEFADIEANETSRLKRYQTQATSRISSLSDSDYGC